MKFNLSELKGKLVSKGYTQRSMAQELGISETSMISKLKGRTTFTAPEMFKLKNILEISDDEMARYFFTPMVVKTRQ